MDSTKRIYLDHAATTPVETEVINVMNNYFLENWHNPSSIYLEGQKASRAIDNAREYIANSIGANPEEIFFTSGGSESNNLAIRGVIDAFSGQKIDILTSSIEHHAIIDPIELLFTQGKISFSLINPTKNGIIEKNEILKNIKNETKLISIMHANNELGAINNIREIVKAIKKERPDILFHTDSVQYVAHHNINVKQLGIDLLSFTGHKFYGPKGVGVLYIKNGTPISPQIVGGGQEQNMRAGTENVASIVGLSKAMEISNNTRDEDIQHDRNLYMYLMQGIKDKISDIGFTGPTEITDRIPGLLSMIIAGVEGESILLGLDINGIAASSGSACSTGSIEPSHVLTSIGMPNDLARGSLRLSIGRMNNEKDIEQVHKKLPKVINNLRNLATEKKVMKKNEIEWLNN
ncbi:MAG: cysteine desulfurase family protein [Dehalococcoidia bacterium]|jgi:cysteine desulfurase|nr:MAG: cysteine desulfurase [Chloroflexota bacterium]|tara:strand:- start:939 stop:2156 length:1218 start_codon:yes stop_codon:yes gene_type:complete